MIEPNLFAEAVVVESSVTGLCILGSSLGAMIAFGMIFAGRITSAAIDRNTGAINRNTRTVEILEERLRDQHEALTEFRSVLLRQSAVGRDRYRGQSD